MEICSAYIRRVPTSRAQDTACSSVRWLVFALPTVCAVDCAVHCANLSTGAIATVESALVRGVLTFRAQDAARTSARWLVLAFGTVLAVDSAARASHHAKLSMDAVSTVGSTLILLVLTSGTFRAGSTNGVSGTGRAVGTRATCYTVAR